MKIPEGFTLLPPAAVKAEPVGTLVYSGVVVTTGYIDRTQDLEIRSIQPYTVGLRHGKTVLYSEHGSSYIEVRSYKRRVFLRKG